jgi:hypothetical protein
MKKETSLVPKYSYSNSSFCLTTFVLLIAVIAIIVGFCLTSCTKWEESVTQVSNVTELTIKGDTNVIDVNVVIIDSSHVNIYNAFNPIIDVTPVFNNNTSVNLVDSSKQFFNITVGGPNITQGDILVTLNPNIIIQGDTIINNNTNNNTTHTDITTNVAGDTTINNLTLNNLFNINNAITVNQHDSLVINNTLFNQVACPYQQCTCKIVNCKIHDHKCKHNKDYDCKDNSCNKHHPSC